MKMEGLILALSFILLIGIANAQNLSNQSNVSLITTHISQSNIGNNSIFVLIPNNALIPNNTTIYIENSINEAILKNITTLIFGKEYTLNNQSSCNFVVFTISTNANVMKCHIENNSFYGPPYPGFLKVSNISFGRPLFFYYNASKNPNETYYKNLSLILPNSKELNFPVKSSILISVYPNGSIFENNNLLYKFSKPQNEIGSYSFFIAGGSYLYVINFAVKFYEIDANINMPTLNFSLQRIYNLVFGYEHGFDNLTITENNNIDMLELFDMNSNTTIANSTSPLIYNIYKLLPMNYANTIANIYFVPYPFANSPNYDEISLNGYDENFPNLISPSLFKQYTIVIFKPYFWVNNSKPVFVSNVVGGKVLEINFTNVNASLVSSTTNFKVTFENKTMETLNFRGTGNLTLNMATNPNETEIISGKLQYNYDNETYYYKFTNLSLTQGQLKKIVIAIPPPPKTNNMLLYIFILLIIIIAIIIIWRIKKHLEKKKRKI